MHQRILKVYPRTEIALHPSVPIGRHHTLLTDRNSMLCCMSCWMNPELTSHAALFACAQVVLDESGNPEAYEINYMTVSMMTVSVNRRESPGRLYDTLPVYV
jgi:hypothetical protein